MKRFRDFEPVKPKKLDEPEPIKQDFTATFTDSQFVATIGHSIGYWSRVQSCPVGEHVYAYRLGARNDSLPFFEHLAIELYCSSHGEQDDFEVRTEIFASVEKWEDVTGKGFTEVASCLGNFKTILNTVRRVPINTKILSKGQFFICLIKYDIHSVHDDTLAIF